MRREIAPPSLKFIPSRSEGFPDVDEIAVYPDRVEVRSAGEWLTFPFVEVAQWPRPAWFWKLLHRRGSRRAFIPVAERDWFDRTNGPSFKFYTQPRLKFHLPISDTEEYGSSIFRRIQYVMELGGFRSWDLG